MLDIFEKRPLATFASSFYVFACVLFSIERNARTVSLIVSFIIFLGALVFIKVLSRLGIGKAVTALSAGLIFASVFAGVVVDVRLAELDGTSYENVDFAGAVHSVVYNSPYSGLYIVKPADSIESVGDVKLLLSSDNGELSAGDEIRCTVNIHPIERDDDYKYSLYASGVMLSATTVGDIELSGTSDDAEIRLSLLRAKLTSRFTSEMSEKSGGFAAALILGDKSSIADSTVRDFKSLGISHILALSGTHLTVLFAVIGKFLPKGGKLRFVRFFVLVFGVLFFMALTGFSASVMRSGIMFIVAATAELADRNADSFTSLSVAVLIICAVSPYAPFDMGLQLSYSAVAGLLISNGIGSNARLKKRSLPSRLFRRLIPAFVVPSAMLPLSWLRFGAISIVSPLANLILIPVITPLIPMLTMLLFVSYIPWLFSPIAKAVDVIITFILDTVETGARAFDYLLPLRGTITAILVILFTVALLCTAIFSGYTRRVLGCVSALLSCVTLLSAQIYFSEENRSTTAYYVSSGSDEALCILSDGHTLLVDIGRYPSAVRSAADHGVCFGGVVDSLLLTHLHQDHISTMSIICNNFHVKSLWLPVPYSESSYDIFHGVCDTAKSLGISVNCYVPGETLTFGGCAFTASFAENIKLSSHPKVTFTLECDDGRLEYTGVSSELANMSCDPVLIVGSHGYEHKGTLTFSGKNTVISPRIASDLDAVPHSATVADTAVIRFKGEPTVTAVTK